MNKKKLSKIYIRANDTAVKIHITPVKIDDAIFQHSVLCQSSVLGCCYAFL